VPAARPGAPMLRAGLAGDAVLHRRPRRGRPRRTVARRARAGVHPGPGRAPGACIGTGRHPGAEGRPRWPGHLPRARAARGLSAAGPAPAQARGARLRLPDRAGGDRHPGRLEHRGPSPGRRAGCVRQRRQGRRAGHPRTPRLQLPWPGLQHRDGHRAVPAHQSLRLRGVAGGVDARLGRSFQPGRGQAGAGRPPRGAVRPGDAAAGPVGARRKAPQPPRFP
jgi:hypothetical protein